MIGEGGEFLTIALDVGFWLTMLGVLAALVRLAIGPSLPDRVVALDMMTILIAAFCGLFAVFADDTAFLDVAIVLALIGFLATAALARFAERRQAREDEAAEDAR